MRYLATAVGVLIAVAGVGMIVAPRGMFVLAPAMVTPRGLLVVAGIRIAIGAILLAAARRSRAPRVVQVLGIIVLIAGLTTPLFGPVRAAAMMTWWLARAPASIRGAGVIAVLLGAALAYVASEAPARSGRKPRS